ncbi:MAG: SDR family NAD(P)-dependent oxidoreductase [Methyloceanibacter sp.]
MSIAASDPLQSFPAGGVAVVLGATGGIGQALSSDIAYRGQFDQILKLGRSTDPAIDILDEESLARAARHAGELGHVRLVIDATGFLHDEHQGPEKTWRDITPEALSRSFALNAIGPALIMKQFLPLLPSTGKAVFATLSARVGSIGDNRLGGWYGYRASKCALNQFVHTASIELQRRRPEAVCVALHPGTVDTPLSQPFSRSGLNVKQPSEAASSLISVIDALGPYDTGGFFDWRGTAVPW